MEPTIDRFLVTAAHRGRGGVGRGARAGGRRSPEAAADWTVQKGLLQVTDVVITAGLIAGGSSTLP